MKKLLTISLIISFSVILFAKNNCSNEIDYNYISNIQEKLSEWNGEDITYTDDVAKVILIVENNGTANYDILHSSNKEMKTSLIKFIKKQTFQNHTKCTPYKILVNFQVKEKATPNKSH